MPFFQTITELDSNHDTIRNRRYGVIETIEGEFVRVRFRPWPKIISMAEIGWLGNSAHTSKNGDRCVLYFNQPLSSPNFLALKYVVTNLGSSYKTFRKALTVLDRIAEIKRTDAIVTEASNLRLSDRFMQRMGWERHLEQSKRRHFIKRFYGIYPSQTRENQPPVRRAS